MILSIEIETICKEGNEDLESISVEYGAFQNSEIVAEFIKHRRVRNTVQCISIN